MRKDGRNRIEWRGNDLCLIGQRTPIVSIVPDAKYSAMWRVRYPDGRMTDMVNVTRARDAARTIAGSILDGRETAAEAPPVEKNHAQ